MLFYVFVERCLGLVALKFMAELVVAVWVDPFVTVCVDINYQSQVILLEDFPDRLCLIL
jgi:hypothetical protein